MALVKPFHISKNIVEHSPRPRPRVGLFVFRTDDISNSSSIIHPQEVSFSLNGRGVDKRHINSMDSRPQRPTNLYNMLVHGTNLLQTIGCFRGSYFIVIALLHDIPLPVYPSLKDYVLESNSACDIPKGPSRISLSCPISRKRIKLPVKGHACKHLEILEVVGSNVTDVVISPDGSWEEAVPEATHQHGDPSSSQNLRPTVLDLTRDENQMECTQSSASVEALTQLPQTLNVYDGQQQQSMNYPVSREVIHMPFLPTSSPHISMPAVHSCQYQGLHVSSLGLSLGRDSDLMERLM